MYHANPVPVRLVVGCHARIALLVVPKVSATGSFLGAKSGEMPVFSTLVAPNIVSCGAALVGSVPLSRTTSVTALASIWLASPYTAIAGIPLPPWIAASWAIAGDVATVATGKTFSILPPVFFFQIIE